MKKYDVVALGELLVDFTESGLSTQGNPMLEANPGGAPCNVLSMLQKLKKKTAFIGKVGNDAFGNMLAETVKEQGIDISSLLTDETVPTTLAFVHTKEDGDRSFSFYRNPGADMMLTESDIDESVIMNAKVFHFGTLSMTDEGNAAATKKAVTIAKEAGDTFMACVLNAVLEKGIDTLAEEDLLEILEFANAASSIITTRKGALKVMPEQQEVISFIRERKGE